MRVLLGVDGVLGSFTRSYLDAVYAVTGVGFNESEIDTWEIKAWPIWATLEDCGVDSKAAKRAVDDLVASPGFTDRMAVLPGAQEAVSAMQGAGVEVFVVTSPWNSSPTWGYDRARWLKREFGVGPRETVITPSKHVVWGDILVDDELANVDVWQRAWPEGEAVLFHGSHNAGDAWGGQRGGWDVVLEAVLG